MLHVFGYLGLGSTVRVEALLFTASGPLFSVVFPPQQSGFFSSLTPMSVLYQEENRLFALPVQMKYVVYPVACADAVTGDQHGTLHLHGC